MKTCPVTVTYRTPAYTLGDEVIETKKGVLYLSDTGYVSLVLDGKQTGPTYSVKQDILGSTIPVEFQEGEFGTNPALPMVLVEQAQWLAAMKTLGVV